MKKLFENEDAMKDVRRKIVEMQNVFSTRCKTIFEFSLISLLLIVIGIDLMLERAGEWALLKKEFLKKTLVVAYTVLLAGFLASEMRSDFLSLLQWNTSVSLSQNFVLLVFMSLQSLLIVFGSGSLLWHMITDNERTKCEI